MSKLFGAGFGMYGYMGKILYIDLARKKFHTENLTTEFCKKYIGGIGFIARLLLDHTPPKLDPYSPDNPLIFAVGPFGGTIFPNSNKLQVGAKSPLTGFIGEAASSSFWAQQFKQAGYDVMVIKGKSDSPCYIFIDDETVSFHDATDLWGLSVHETDRTLKESLGDETISVACIGLAGENLVPMACISNDIRRHAGRTGLGAVMGSKKLKAIAVRGTKTVNVANIDRLMEISLDYSEKSRGPSEELFWRYGTPGIVPVLQSQGILPTRNWRQATFEHAEEIGGEFMMKNYVRKIVACSSCAVACDHICNVKEGPYANSVATINYESLYAFGPECGVYHFPAIIEATELCDYYGLDSISTGVTIGWAMECFERGLITEQQTNGLKLNFGNYDAMIELIHLIVKRQGIGNLLADGVKKASEKLGKGSEHFAMHIKGLELPGYDLRGLKTAAIGFAVCARGGCHERSCGPFIELLGERPLGLAGVDRFKLEKGRGKIIVMGENYNAIMDSLIYCKFGRKFFTNAFDEFANAYTLITGIEMSPRELFVAGERIVNMRKIFNIYQGWTRADDHLPPRIMYDPIPDGLSKGSRVTPEEFKLGIEDYYQERGWDVNTGIPTEDKLKELGLEDFLGVLRWKP
ncbi:MAG: aldehyde ferredoxin oxidoreductase family protein [Candidatus Bathyarchaeia archaeon]